MKPQQHSSWRPAGATTTSKGHPETPNDSTIMDDDNITIPSRDVLSLIQCHLVESGLTSSSRVLAAETGGSGMCPGLTSSAKTRLVDAAIDGRWGEVLSHMETIDVDRVRCSRMEDRRLDGAGREDDPAPAAPAVPSSSGTCIAPLERTIALSHEMAILELADIGEYDLAYAVLGSCSSMLDRALPTSMSGEGGDDDDDDDDDGGTTTASYSRSADVERRIVALISTRRSRIDDDGFDDNGRLPPPPVDYYGPMSSSSRRTTKDARQARRDRIAKSIRRHVPEFPSRRLVTLLQQSVKWQCHTGTFPTVERLFRMPGGGTGGGGDGDNDDDDDDGDDDGRNEGEHDLGDEKKRKKKRKRKVKKRKNNDGYDVVRKFDLVLGNVVIDVTSHGTDRRRGKDGGGGITIAAPGTVAGSSVERVPSRMHQTIRLGKRSHVECATFLPDGTGLITGSSDGFVEVWGEARRSSSSASESGIAVGGGEDVDYETLRTSDLPYQRNDDLMMHDSSVLAVDVSNDGTLLGTTSSNGTVCIWKLSDGKMLRKLERAHGGIVGLGGGDKGAAVTCIRFSPDGSKILTGGHDSTCREFGLIASRMLKEFRGHKSYVNCCAYVFLPPSVLCISGGGVNNDIISRRESGSNRLLAVITGSADGSVIVWDGKTAEPIREINPPVPTSANAIVQDKDSIVGSKSIHTVVHLHSPPNTMIVVPRSDRAYLMSYTGAVVRVFARDDVQGCEFLAASVSPNNRWLFVAADDGKCVVFDVGTGKAEKVIRSFICGSGESDKPCEVTGIICHPHRGLIGGYSNDKGQKRGILALWK